MTPGFCRDCLTDAPEGQPRCAGCGSPRLIRHRELDDLSLAHVDCDAFYATIEKRDDPSLADKPLIVGGGKRGVVTTACYLARTFGVRSAMPMFEARRLCPHATVIPPNMAKYAEVSHDVRRLMLDLTPLVEPISIDEAFMDLSGTARVHGMSPAQIAGALFPQCRERDRDHGLDRALRQQVPRQDRLRSRQAARLCGARPNAKPKTSWRSKPVTFIFGVGRVTEEKFAKRRHPHHRRPADALARSS